jgi:hypothetical protein
MAARPGKKEKEGKMERPIKGYKGFNKDLKCRDFQYAVGETYEHSGEVSLCKSGFHFCESPLDVFGYYPPSDSRFADVSGSGDIRRATGDSKVACKTLHVETEITLSALIGAGVKFVLDKVDWKDNKESNTGHQSAATNTGYQSAATNTGDRSAATNTGHRSAATNTGHQSAATNTGDQSAATNTGDRSAATNTGYQSAATNTGYRSAATNTGYQSAATNTGYQSAATVEGKESIACGLGYENKARGALGCWLVLADRRDDGSIRSIRSAKVDGKTIKEMVFYEIRKSKICKAK